METYRPNVYTASPSLPKATTPPPKVISLKFRPAPVNHNDRDVFSFDRVNLGFTYATSDKANRSFADQFHIEIHDLENQVVKSYMQNAFAPVYPYWQRAFEEKTAEFEDVDIDDSIVNARVTITPINSKGQGKRSTFIMPMRDLLLITPEDAQRNPVSLVLAKYWHLFSEAPEEVHNRPKQMHIYIGSSNEDILLDKEELNDTKWRYNTIGNFKEVNQEMFRWVIQDEDVYTKLDKTDEFIPMTTEEIEFIEYLTDSFNDKYISYIANQGLTPIDTFVFKIAVENPRDHNDSIIIYLMKETRWHM